MKKNDDLEQKLTALANVLDEDPNYLVGYAPALRFANNHPQAYKLRLEMDEMAIGAMILAVAVAFLHLLDILFNIGIGLGLDRTITTIACCGIFIAIWLSVWAFTNSESWIARIVVFLISIIMIAIFVWLISWTKAMI